mmetsp:Transcript_17581/g.30995  ORF Transcript_17581/g.30995 Transcript_17581/m.30995 type:complete len:317 (-) Transcript_17581:345-1295(-)
MPQLKWADKVEVQRVEMQECTSQSKSSCCPVQAYCTEPHECHCGDSSMRRTHHNSGSFSSSYSSSLSKSRKSTPFSSSEQYIHHHNNNNNNNNNSLEQSLQQQEMDLALELQRQQQHKGEEEEEEEVKHEENFGLFSVEPESEDLDSDMSRGAGWGNSFSSSSGRGCSFESAVSSCSNPTSSTPPPPRKRSGLFEVLSRGERTMSDCNKGNDQVGVNEVEEGATALYRNASVKSAPDLFRRSKSVSLLDKELNVKGEFKKCYNCDSVFPYVNFTDAPIQDLPGSSFCSGNCSLSYASKQLSKRANRRYQRQECFYP